MFFLLYVSVCSVLWRHNVPHTIDHITFDVNSMATYQWLMVHTGGQGASAWEPLQNFCCSFVGVLLNRLFGFALFNW